MTQPPPPSPPPPRLPEDLGERLADALTISVGVGVLAWQRAQVRRRELERLAGRMWRDLQAGAAPGAAHQGPEGTE